MPRTRDGEFSPTIFERYQRNEKAPLASILEMYVSGVSTRKVSQVVEELCGKKMSKSFVSDLTKTLDPMVKEWKNRSLSDTIYPFLMVYVLYLKVREEHRVISISCHIAIGITEEGEREIIDLMIQNGESDETWSTFFDYLKERRLTGTQLVISDAHAGLKSAIFKSPTGSYWQRCQIHFMRNILSSVPKKDAKPFREEVKTIFRFNDIELARVAKNALLETYADQPKYDRTCKKLDEGFEDAFQYTISGKGHNRLNQEVRRREKVIRIFPNEDSANRLIGAVLLDIHEDWISS